MKETKQQKASGRRFLTKIAIALLLILLVAIIGCYYVITNWNKEAYAFTTIPSSDVNLSVSINDTGHRALTILDSSERMIAFKVYSQRGSPKFFMQRDSERLRADLQLFYNPHDFETFIYLPAGPSYNVTITCRDFDKIKSSIVIKYRGGNLTLWVNDTVHGLYRYSGLTN